MRETARARTALTLLGLAVTGPAAASQTVEYPGSDFQELNDAVYAAGEGGTVILTRHLTADDAYSCYGLPVGVTLIGDEAVGEPVEVPGLLLNLSSPVHLENLRITDTCSAWGDFDYDGSYDDYDGDGQFDTLDAGLLVLRGDHSADRVFFGDAGGSAVSIMNGTLTLTDTTIEALTSAPAITVESRAVDSALTLYSSAVVSNEAGGVVAQARNGLDVDLIVSGTTFAYNESGGRAAPDIDAQGVTTLQVSESTFVGDPSLPDSELPWGAGSIFVQNADVVIADSTFTGTRGTTWGGAIFAESETAYSERRLEVRRTEFVDTSVSLDSGYGGAIYAEGMIVELQRLGAEGVAGLSGAFLKVWNAREVTADWIRVAGFESGGESGAIYLHNVYSAILQHVHVCGGSGPRETPGLGLRANNVQELTLTNGVFNSLNALAGSAVLFEYGTLYAAQNTFDDSEVAALLQVDLANLALHNTIFSRSTGTGVLASDTNAEGTPEMYNLFFDLGQAVDGLEGQPDASVDVLDQDPLFFSGYLSRGEGCAAYPLLDEGSPAIDAGNPAAAFNDPDGTRADIGAFGGPDASFPDSDEDGYVYDEDCNDDDPAVNPGAEEIVYNFIDDDCDDSTPDDDLDHDGYGHADDCDDGDAARSPGLDEVPYNGVDDDCDESTVDDDLDGDGFKSEVDCDDADGAVNPDAEEVPLNDLDEDCDGKALNGSTSGGCAGCASGSPPPGPWAALALAALLVRRRRRA
ncbi:MAG: putative metal-binding motif-containing protein [Alphaproteobacteria bacterium]|nr:putative metal-binding motif-containing protein [Alphaproteobacteria bacterium]